MTARSWASAGLLLLASCQSLGSTSDLRPTLPAPPADWVADQLGPVAFKLILATKTPVKDENQQKLVDHVMKDLTTAAHGMNCKATQWTVRIVEGPVDASAFPGGGVLVTSELVKLAQRGDTLDEQYGLLATAISHEMAHVCAGHFALRLQKEAELLKKIGNYIQTHPEFAQQGFPPALRPVIFALLGSAHELSDVIPFVAQHEQEADANGLKLMGAGGLKPKIAVEFWSKMGELRKSSFSLTHRSDEQRVSMLAGIVAHDFPDPVKEKAVDTARAKVAKSTKHAKR